jgi:hypothetical protein
MNESVGGELVIETVSKRTSEMVNPTTGSTPSQAMDVVAER